MARFAVRAKRHGKHSNLVQLKYSQIGSPMHEPIVQECRGLVLDEAERWRVVCRAYDKFFNIGEPNATEIDWPAARVYEKLDGSLMTLYRYGGAWHVASSGVPDASGVAHESGLSDRRNGMGGCLALMKCFSTNRLPSPSDDGSCGSCMRSGPPLRRTCTSPARFGPARHSGRGEHPIYGPAVRGRSESTFIKVGEGIGFWVS
jgi:hypothetical protein